MARSFRLPDLGEGIHEGEVLSILVSVGDEVKEGDPILEVETDKAAVEIPSPYTGTVREILIKEGDIINVGDVLMTFSNGEEEEAVETERRVEKPVEPSKVTEPESEKARAEGPVPASPATRRLARELGVDLRQVTPTGPGGLVSADDVRAFAEGGAAAERVPEAPSERPAEAAPMAFPVPGLPDFAKWGPVERVPVRSIRRATAKQMTLAWSQIPHVHNQEWVDMTKLEAFRKNHKAEIEEKGGKLTHTVFAMKAAATALKTYPKFNATLDTEAGELVVKKYFHIGVAVNTDDGLIVPVIKDVDRKSIVEISIELNDLVQRTRERKASLEEMQGGTFTITNVGPMGGGFFAPIINYPEVAILGMGSTSMQAVVKEKGENEYDIVPRLMMPIVLCIDHRVLDGADALLFIRVLKEALEDPEELLITMI
ncbi:MAG: dihydrolipoamide acetyltransferase family protein [Desulfobacteraceae bacterium]|jgi:pyruvate dehydrogenase E2 component (dihydrolipoamide acetyltransferase)